MPQQLTSFEKELSRQESVFSSKGYFISTQPLQVFSSNFTSGDQNLLYVNSVAGGATITSPTQNVPFTVLNTGTASGDTAILQSKLYQRYWTYRTHVTSFAVSFGATPDNCVKCAGIYDDNDGFFFQYDDTNGLQVVHRTATSGSPVDTVVGHSDFNLDKLDGNGKSRLVAGRDFFLNRSITFGIAYNYYGTQGAKFYIAYGDCTVYLHEFVFTGDFVNVPFMRTASLPIRFEAKNTDTTASGSSLFVGSVSQSIQDDESGDFFQQFSVTNGSTAIAATSQTVWQDIIAIRPKTTFNSIQNRGNLIFNKASLYADTAPAVFRIITNVTYTGGTWNSVDANSIAEFSVSTGTQGGTPQVLDHGYIASSRNGASTDNPRATGNNLKIGLDTLSGAQYCIVVQALKFTTTNSNVSASITWREEV